MTQIAAGVFVTQATQDLTMTTVLVNGSRALVIDPAWAPAELDSLAEWIRSARLRVVAGFATHSHHDHVLWHPDWVGVPRYASVVTAARAREHRAELVTNLGPAWPPQLAELVGDLSPWDEPTLPWPEPVELVRHDAHTPGHTALWLPGPRVLIAGDMLSDVEPPLPEETGPSEYLAGLDTLLPYVTQARIVVPGHGNPDTDGVARWQRDRAAVLAMS